jgi:hypothetical protein
MVKNCWICSRANSANCQTKFLSRAIPIRSPIAGRGIMGIGNSRRTANAARRLMQQQGLGQTQVAQVRGSAITLCARRRIRLIHRTGGFH